MVAQPKPIRVLLIEDGETDAMFIRRMLVRYPSKFEIDHVSMLADALVKISKSDYDIALVDLQLPDARGLDSFEKIRVLDARIPIVVLTGVDDENLALLAIESGAQDFISKTHLTGQMLWRAVHFAIARQRKVLGYQADADTDPLTNLPNRRHLESRFLASLQVAEKSALPMSMAFLDLDHFKSVNDTHGHFVGDSLLKHFAKLLTDHLEDEMSAARLGGEEFAILLPGVELQAACQRIQRFLDDLSSDPIKLGELAVPITASAGVVEIPYGDSWEQAYVVCDAALYEAKTSGRNQLVQRSRS